MKTAGIGLVVRAPASSPIWAPYHQNDCSELDAAEPDLLAPDVTIASSRIDPGEFPQCGYGRADGLDQSLPGSARVDRRARVTASVTC